MKKLIFALCLIFSIVMIGVGFAYANALTVIGAILSTMTFGSLLWFTLKEEVERKTHMKL
jgi:hypothetical protein